MPIIGDAKSNLQALLAKTPREEKRVTVPSSSPLREPEETTVSKKWISAARAVEILRNKLPSDTILFGDDASHTYYAIKHFDILQEGTFFFDDVFGTMGHAIGYAIGAKLASPDQPIACLTGDGCILMHGTEISTAACHQVPVIFIVFNNGRLDMVDKGMKHNIGRSVGTVYETKVDIHLFAQSLGAASFRCMEEFEIEEAMTLALKETGPVVIEIMVDPEEIPPTMVRG